MKGIARFMLRVKGPEEKADVIWNTAGSLIYALANMILAFLVIRMAGEEAGGIFAMGFSTFGQQMFTLSYYGLRPFQITDGGPDQGGLSFGEYLFHRKITAGIAVAAAGLFAAWHFLGGSYSMEKAAAVFMLAGYKIVDGYADVYESEFQRQGKLYLTGKSTAFRTILSAGVFLFTLGVAGKLLAACAAALFAQILGLCLFDFSVMECLSQADRRRRKGKVMEIFTQGGLLFLSVFLDFYIFSAARYAVDLNMDDGAAGYFNLIFMPTSVIYLVANFVIRPFLTRLTVCWNSGDNKGFKQIIWKISGLIAFLTVLAVGGTLCLGRPVLRIMELALGPSHEGSLTAYVPAFVIIVLGGGIYAFGNLLYYSLVIMRRQKRIFAVYVVVALAAFWIAPALVRQQGLNGAAGSYCLFMVMQAAGFGAWVLWEFKGRSKR